MKTVAENLIAAALEETSPRALSEWLEANEDLTAPRVMANGLAVPIVRVEWNAIDDFFDILFSSANEEIFAGRLPKCHRQWNRRFRRVAGRIDCKRRHIELSHPHYEACGTAALGIVFLHELIHLDLYTDGLPFGHTANFKRRSRGLGMPDVHHELPIPDRLRSRSRRYLYRCICGRELESMRRFRVPRACAACCRKFNKGRYDERFRLIYIGTNEPILVAR